MLLDRTHTKWFFASLIILGIATLYYLPYTQVKLNGPSGNSWSGLTYGIIGSFFILIAGGIGIRKKIRTWRVGRAQTWMRAHIWLGLLSFPMILFHAGFDFGPTWGLTWIMMWMFVIIIVSGVLGLVLQHYLPQMLTTRIRKETIYEQIDYVLGQLRWEADWLVSGVCGSFPEEYLDPDEMAQIKKAEAAEAAHKEAMIEFKKVEAAAKKAGEKPPPRPAAPPKPLANPGKRPDWQVAKGIRDPKDRKNKPIEQEGSSPFKEFYLKEVQGYLLGKSHRDFASDVRAQAVFSRVKTLLPPTLHGPLKDLELVVEERRQLVLQKKVHNWLHTWLLIHGPISWAMMLLSVVHAVMALYY